MLIDPWGLTWDYFSAPLLTVVFALKLLLVFGALKSEAALTLLHDNRARKEQKIFKKFYQFLLSRNVC